MKIKYTGTKQAWEAILAVRHPTARICDESGGRFFAIDGGMDVGMYSTVQGGGWYL